MASRDHTRLLPIAAVAVTLLLWSSAFVGIRCADRQLSAGALALGRLVVGSLALGAVAMARREPLPSPRTLLRIAACGVLWFGAYNVALNQAETRVDPGTASMLVNTGPILIAILAGVVLLEGFPRRLLFGCLVSFAGVAVIGLATSRHGLDQGWGTLLCLAAALAYAVGMIAQKPALGEASALQVTWLACTVGAIACLPFAPSLVNGLRHASATTVTWTVYLGLAPTAVGFCTWAYALARTTAGALGSTTYLVPPLAVLLGWAFLGEVPPALAFPGGVLCLAGVAIARSRVRRRPAIVVAYSTSSGAAPECNPSTASTTSP
jgi:drug/metabolite transporter (DMT)-like permease